MSAHRFRRHVIIIDRLMCADIILMYLKSATERKSKRVRESDW